MYYKLYLKSAILLLSLTIVSFCFGQNIKCFEISAQKGENVLFLDKGYSAFSIETDGEMNSFSLQIGLEKFTFFQNQHFESNRVSNLILLDSTVTKISIFSEEETIIKIQLCAFDGSYSNKTKSLINTMLWRSKKDQCDKPMTIDQDIWREGLPEPKPNPVSTKVEHLIVHHSATYNTITDYLMAIRNIYLYHINNNGWDDVGYNFLITADGILWAGRDGQGQDDDNIRGAHFCAKNSNTMGVCLVGNYSEIPPSDTLIGTLCALLAWKTKKDNLQPLAYSFHPIGSPSGFYLPSICAHRDGYKEGVYNGCQTECPGNFTYTLLDTIRKKTVKLLLECDYKVHTNKNFSTNETLMVFGEKDLIQIFNSLGQIAFSGNGLDYKTFTLPTGFYIALIKDEHNTKIYKFYRY